MLKTISHKQFDRDLKLAKKRGKDLQKIAFIIKELQNGKTLPAKNRNHKLKGSYADCLECHIEPDWLLIYALTEVELILIRTGTHSDLFSR